MLLRFSISEGTCYVKRKPQNNIPHCVGMSGPGGIMGKLPIVELGLAFFRIMLNMGPH